MKIAGLEKRVTAAESRRLAHDPRFDDTLIGIYGNWRIYLNADQRYLGRSYAWWAGRHHIDLMDISDLLPRDRDELFETIVGSFRSAVANLWGSTHVNYAWLGNETEHHRGHGHLHMIPRYFGKQPQFAGESFPDLAIGKNYAPYEPYRAAEPIRNAIRDVLKNELQLEQIDGYDESSEER